MPLVVVTGEAYVSSYVGPLSSSPPDNATLLLNGVAYQFGQAAAFVNHIFLQHSRLGCRLSCDRVSSCSSVEADTFVLPILTDETSATTV